MHRIDEKFRELREKNQGALIAYVMAGYPTVSDTSLVVRGLIRGGADIIELGFPFSDPMADGPVIQRAASASLKNGVTVPGFLDMVRRIRSESDIPLAVMTYTNILYRYGYGDFISDAADAGIDGYILPDMSVEESGDYLAAARRHGAGTIFLVSPNTEDRRVRMIARASSGFLYMVAVYGTTGSAGGVQDYSVEAVRRIKGITGDGIPLGVGFGVSSPGDVRRYMSAGADAVIVGSAMLRLIGDTTRDALEDAVSKFTRQLKDATHL